MKNMQTPKQEQYILHRIGSTTYKVKMVFSDDGRETIQKANKEKMAKGRTVSAARPSPIQLVTL